MEYIRSHYRIEDYTKYKMYAHDQHGIIKHLILSPIFENDARYLLKELHRQSNLTSLYYPLYKGDVGIEEHASVEHSMATVLSQMIPVLPRPQPEYTLKKLGENKPNSSVLGTEMPFALYYMNKRYSSMPKIAINTKIIIVGASNAELGFLEQLLFG
uniref:Uncharacterized protein n=1 Tax=Timema monikensis TaxID=170555 RepID=A0A7R9EK39_9NEOP|nr:unnamed protein product [Timema monikensis]